MSIYGEKIYKQRDGSYNITFKGNLFNVCPEYPTAEMYGEEYTFAYLKRYELSHPDEFEEWVEPEPYIPTKEDKLQEIQSEVLIRVQQLLDDKARERNYDDGVSLASYATSSNPKFRKEAEAFVVWRDNVWAKCYELLAQYQAGEIDLMSVDDVMKEIPTMEWE